MTTLLIDAGNTFLKWACLVNGTVGASRSVVHHGVELREWQDALAALTPAPTRVVAANVAGAAFALRLREFTRARWQLEPEFPAATRSALGVTNAYARPSALGIDRWLAMLAAWHVARAPLLCANAAAASCRERA